MNAVLSVLLPIVCAGVLTATVVQAAEPPFEPSAADMDTLLFHAQRYGSTARKRSDKKIAREELFDRGAKSLDYLMSRVHIRNFWIHDLIGQLVSRLDKKEGVPVLLSYLRHEIPDQRKYAVYFLGFYDAPEHWRLIVSHLEDDDTAGAAIRTLGKWRVDDATLLIIPFLELDNERRRIAAANALRDISDRRAVPYLVDALGDPVFTVRRTASRALTKLGSASEKALVRLLPDAGETALREAIRTLGDMRSRRAVRSLRRLLDHENASVRTDAALALAAIDADNIRRWLRGTSAEHSIDPFRRYIPLVRRPDSGWHLQE